MELMVVLVLTRLQFLLDHHDDTVGLYGGPITSGIRGQVIPGPWLFC